MSHFGSGNSIGVSPSDCTNHCFCVVAARTQSDRGQCKMTPRVLECPRACLGVKPWRSLLRLSRRASTGMERRAQGRAAMEHPSAPRSLCMQRVSYVQVCIYSIAAERPFAHCRFVWLRSGAECQMSLRRQRVPAILAKKRS